MPTVNPDAPVTFLANVEQAENRVVRARDGRPRRTRVTQVIERKRLRYHLIVTFTVEFDREEDGRWIGLIEAIPGCHVYGATREETLAKVEALALHIVAERLEDGEITAEEATSVNFVVSAAA